MSKRVVWRKNKQTERPFIVQRVARPFTQGNPEYGETLGENEYDKLTGEMKIVTPTGQPTDYVIEEHELGHLLVDRYGEELTPLEKEQLKYELADEHHRVFYLYANTYERDLLGEAIAETFAARRFGWRNTDLGFNPALGTPKIWAFVNMVASKYEIDKRLPR